MTFALDGVVNGARRGRLFTRRGVVVTPTFLPLAPRGAVVHLGPDDVMSAGGILALIDPLHLEFQPGSDLIAEMGGVHCFMGWPGPLAATGGVIAARAPSDGGSPFLESRNDDAAVAVSPFDGTRLRWTPERCAEVQLRLGVDIAIAPATPLGASKGAGDALTGAIRWHERWLVTLLVQGDPRGLPLRLALAEGSATGEETERQIGALRSHPIDGFAVRLWQSESSGAVLRLLPTGLPRLLLQVTSLAEARHAVMAGADLVSGSFPMLLAQQGQLLDGDAVVAIGDERYGTDPAPPVDGCRCPVCTSWSRAYLHHLFRANEMLAPRLAAVHNLWHVGRAIAGR